MAQTKTLTIEPLYPLKPLTNIQNVLVIGCGGTGSYVIPNLVRLLLNSRQPVCLTLADADTVEPKNLIRQNFIKSDVGKNKAEALARRYSTAFGTQIQFLPQYLESANSIKTALRNAQVNNINYGNSTPLIISCVDNIKARKFMVEALQLYYPNGGYIIDCGNEDVAGQVLLTCITSAMEPSTGVYRTPHLFEVFPELVERAKTDKLASELSCAEMAESSNQFGFVNLNAATFALNFVYDLLSGNPISTYMVEFSIKNKFSQRPLTKSSLESWSKLGLALRLPK
jgi:PRTRC genetic system ThiF family protein